MTDIRKKIAHLDRLIQTSSAALALYQLRVSGLKISEIAPKQINRLDQFVEAHKTHIRYLESELEQLRSISSKKRHRTAARLHDTLGLKELLRPHF